MTRVLILTAGFGEGHNAAARNLSAAIAARAGPGTADVADLFALASPAADRLARRLYLLLINRAPRLWNGFYGWVDRSPVLPRHLWLFRPQLRALAALLARGRPDVVCSTYPVYGFIAARLAAKGLLTAPHHLVVTDSISINSLWTQIGRAHV